MGDRDAISWLSMFLVLPPSVPCNTQEGQVNSPQRIFWGGEWTEEVHGSLFDLGLGSGCLGSCLAASLQRGPETPGPLAERHFLLVCFLFLWCKTCPRYAVSDISRESLDIWFLLHSCLFREWRVRFGRVLKMDLHVYFSPLTVPLIFVQLRCEYLLERQEL